MNDSDRSPAARAGAPTKRPARRGFRWGNVGLAIFSSAIPILALEIGYRALIGVSMTDWPNWRIENTVIMNSRDVIVPESRLGWTLRPNNTAPGHNTIDHGLRRNNAASKVETGAVLAVGDSFTEGWEVEDEESWPAQLERRIKRTVLNAGVGGYGTDQVVLRAEQLLPILKPKTLIVGFLSFDIYRAGHTHFGSPKPYFTIENDALKYHPPALLKPRRERGTFTAISYGVRDALGHLAVVDYLLARLAPDFWYGDERREYLKAPNDPIRVTCLLLDRLKKKTDAEGIRAVLFMQYYAMAILDDDDPPEDAAKVLACAKTLGYEIVDQFASLRAISGDDSAKIAPYYVFDGKNYGHMSPKGNEHAAEMLAKVLGE
jgi:lysophospholipase L1-like esterase